jgi:hypothetical protein
MLAAQPLDTERLADLLVRGRREHEVAERLEALACERGDGHGVRGGVPLHVERAASPDVVVA